MTRQYLFTTILLFSIIGVLKSQDTTFKPYFRYNASTGNYTIFYRLDSSRVYETLFVPPTKIQPELSANVLRESDKLVYHYKIINGNNSKQRIIGFDFQTYGNMDFITLPNGWFIRPYKYQPFVQFDYKEKRATSIPIGSSFAFTQKSMGIPKPIEVRFVGDKDTIDMAFEIEPWEEVEFVVDSIVNNPDNKYVIRKTIGPADPPSPFVPIDFLDTLLSYTHPSIQLGWLKSTDDNDCDDDEKKEDGISINIEKRILKAKRELEKGDTFKGSRELEKLLKKVERIYKQSQEAEKKKRTNEIVMTSEAYALLKYNTEYLINQLSEKKKK